MIWLFILILLCDCTWCSLIVSLENLYLLMKRFKEKKKKGVWPFFSQQASDKDFMALAIDEESLKVSKVFSNLCFIINMDLHYQHFNYGTQVAVIIQKETFLKSFVE